MIRLMYPFMPLAKAHIMSKSWSSHSGCLSVNVIFVCSCVAIVEKCSFAATSKPYNFLKEKNTVRWCILSSQKDNYVPRIKHLCELAKYDINSSLYHHIFENEYHSKVVAQGGWTQISLKWMILCQHWPCKAQGFKTGDGVLM